MCLLTYAAYLKSRRGNHPFLNQYWSTMQSAVLGGLFNRIAWRWVRRFVDHVCPENPVINRAPDHQCRGAEKNFPHAEMSSDETAGERPDNLPGILRRRRITEHIACNRRRHVMPDHAGNARQQAAECQA